MVDNHKIKALLDKHGVSESEQLANALTEILNTEFSRDKLSKAVHDSDKAKNRLRGIL
uniref:hypothetical protein n=1 Tax=Streptococcus pluranimalium TaxID=82348 RepID=UPI003F68D37C